ncbi:MAG TPA: hypothetical protein VMF51_24090 [Nocardioides sp.]|uniref:hypothetical protein n=1 Tax=Nocardioides sp. TaxID=35761 RepID=UPI002BC12D5E|nr:hypothetical protein [Nocardioides sp.]HTW18229.1 hypothetical protein [Nocardioides sp.]
MNDLEQRLADELGAVATELRTPRVAVPGLVAAGRRERVRRRSAVAGLVVAAVAVVATSSVAGLRGDHDRAVEPAPAPVVDDLARPLSLPWWETIDDQDDPDMGVLHAAGSETPFRATDVRYLQGRTFVGNDAQWWWELVEGALEPVADLPLTGPPVVGPDSARLWVEDTGTDYGVGVALRDGSGTAFSLPPGERPLAIGLTEDGRLLMTRGAEVFLGRDGRRGPTPVLGVPEGAEIAARAGGFALYAGGRVVAGRIDDTGRIYQEWGTDGDGAGVWSDDGERYAEASDGEVRVATRSGETGVPLDADLLRVVGWESETEVVVAQWIEVDGAVTGVWRCSTSEVRCAEVADAPNGKALLPGL